MYYSLLIYVLLDEWRVYDLVGKLFAVVFGFITMFLKHTVDGNIIL